MIVGGDKWSPDRGSRESTAFKIQSEKSLMNEPENQQQVLSAWSPLGQPLFRALWIAAVMSNIGTLMQNVGAAWLMTSLSRSPLLVSLVQTATTLPLFLLSLPAGALADVLDRRRILLFTQSWMLVAAASLGLLTLAGQMTPGVLLALTFALGLGAALNAPAWQAIIPELVPGEQLMAAVALNSVGFNMARAVGPALGGLLVASAGSGVVFLINAASFVGVIAVLFYWKRSAVKSISPAERIIGAMWAGVRYVRHTPILQAIIVRAGVFAFFGTPLLALLPLFVRHELGLGSAGYGVLLGAFGVGAILGAAVLPRLRYKFSPEFLIYCGFFLFAAVMIAVAYVPSFLLLNGFMLMGGAAWLAILSIFNTSVQVTVPSWVRGRALAFYLLIFFGGMAGGSFLWGAVAEFIGIPLTLSGAAAGLIIGLLATFRFRLEVVEMDLRPSMHYPEHTVVVDPQPEHGPVMVMVEYCIDPEKSRDFIRAMQGLGRVRRRDGAFQWGLYHDTADPGRYVETFVVESWAEHLRQHERITMADRQAEDQARSFHIENGRPRVSHLIHAVDGPKQ